MSRGRDEFAGGWREALADLRTGWRPLVAFELLYKLLSVALFAPILAWFIRALIRSSGNHAVSNYELVEFFLSPQGVVLIVVTATAAFTLQFFELGGLTIIAIGIRQGHSMSAIRTLQAVGNRLSRLFLLGFWQFVAVGGLAAVALFVAVVTKAVLLSEADINYYLQVKPPEFWAAVAIVAAVALVAAVASVVLLLRWIFSVPILILDAAKPRSALAASGRMIRGSGRRVFGASAWWLIRLVLILVLIAAIRWAVEAVLLGIAGDHVKLVIAIAGFIVGLEFVLSVAVGFMASTSFASLIARLFLELRSDVLVPSSFVNDGRPAVRRQRNWWGVGIFGLAAVCLLVAGVAASTIVSQIRLDDRPVEVTAHRGSERRAPENTLEAVLQACEDGADFAEIDVQQTADGVIVLLHDSDLRRVASLDRQIWEISSTELAELDVGSWFSPEFSAARIATLEQVLEAAQDRIKLNIELKYNGHDEGFEAAVARLIGHASFEGQCIVTSLDYRGVQEIVRHDARLRTGLIVTANIGDMMALDVDLLSVNASSVTRDLVARAHQAGKQVHVWTVNDPEQMLSMIHRGVDNIITSRPEVLRDVLRTREQLSESQKALLFVADFLDGRM